MMDTDNATAGTDAATATATTGDDAPSGQSTAKDSGGTVDRSSADTSGLIAGTDLGDSTGVADWSPALTEEGTGIALDGEYPANYRLRAERMFDDGLEVDPDNLITPEAIADAGKRITAERAHEEAANPLVSAGMKVAELERIAESQGVDISTAANNEDRVRIINEARVAGVARPANEEVR